MFKLILNQIRGRHRSREPLILENLALRQHPQVLSLGKTCRGYHRTILEFVSDIVTEIEYQKTLGDPWQPAKRHFCAPEF
jgi:hypothetical protein